MADDCFLGIDYGLERTGLAISAGSIAFPLQTLSLSRLGSRKALLDAIARQVATRQATAVVMGLPLTAEQGETLTSRQVRNVCARLRRRIPLPFFYMPEYLSSREAMADLRDCGLDPARARQVLDQQAACRILQSFLDQPPARRLSA